MAQLVVQVVSRLSVGGSVAQAILTAAAIRQHGFESVLLHGEPPPGEGSMHALADRLGVERIAVASLQRELGPRDLASTVEVARALRRLRPAVVHTHAAKAGAVGRVAARLARVPVTVHTFHGHVLRGYFGPRKEQAFRRIERLLSHLADEIVAVSDEVRDDLVELGIVSPERIRTIGVGFPMDDLVLSPSRHAALRAATRAEHGIPGDAPVVTFLGRLVPIKRADRFLEAAGRVAASGARFLVIGDGELRESLERSPAGLALGEHVRFLGYRDDVAPLLHASDVVVLTSDAEGTPVSLIEAGACGIPVVGTDVGGVGAVVADGTTGFVVPRDDVAAIARAVDRLLADPLLAASLGAAGRARVEEAFSLERLARDHAALYNELLATR